MAKANSTEYIFLVLSEGSLCTTTHLFGPIRCAAAVILQHATGSLGFVVAGYRANGRAEGIGGQQWLGFVMSFLRHGTV